MTNQEACSDAKMPEMHGMLGLSGVPGGPMVQNPYYGRYPTNSMPMTMPMTMSMPMTMTMPMSMPLSMPMPMPMTMPLTIPLPMPMPQIPMQMQMMMQPRPQPQPQMPIHNSFVTKEVSKDDINSTSHKNRLRKIMQSAKHDVSHSLTPAIESTSATEYPSETETSTSTSTNSHIEVRTSENEMLSVLSPSEPSSPLSGAMTDVNANMNVDSNAETTDRDQRTSKSSRTRPVQVLTPLKTPVKSQPITSQKSIPEPVGTKVIMKRKPTSSQTGSGDASSTESSGTIHPPKKKLMYKDAATGTYYYLNEDKQKVPVSIHSDGPVGKKVLVKKSSLKATTKPFETKSEEPKTEP